MKTNRPTYFDGRFLTARDLTREQSYHRPKPRSAVAYAAPSDTFRRHEPASELFRLLTVRRSDPDAADPAG